MTGEQIGEVVQGFEGYFSQMVQHFEMAAQHIKLMTIGQFIQIVLVLVLITVVTLKRR